MIVFSWQFVSCVYFPVKCHFLSLRFSTLQLNCCCSQGNSYFRQFFVGFSSVETSHFDNTNHNYNFSLSHCHFASVWKKHDIFSIEKTYFFSASISKMHCNSSYFYFSLNNRCNHSWISTAIKFTDKPIIAQWSCEIVWLYDYFVCTKKWKAKFLFFVYKKLLLCKLFFTKLKILMIICALIVLCLVTWN